MSYKLYDAAFKNHASEHCAPPNPYYSITTLLPILGILLDFLEHSKEIKKAYTVCELINKYLEGVPQSQEKNEFMAKLRATKERLLHFRESTPEEEEYIHFHSSPGNYTSIVFQKELPGIDQQNCRETFGRLIQTAVNVYKETAKHPNCQPNGYIDESLYYPDNLVKPQKPYQFIVIYQHPPSSNYQPDYKGIPIIPLPVENRRPSLEQLFPNLQVANHKSKIPNEGNVEIQYVLPHDQSPYNPFLPLPHKEKPAIDVLALIKQYNIQHPNAPYNQDTLLELVKNLTGKPPHDPNQPSVNIPHNILNIDNLQKQYLPSISNGSPTPGSHYTHLYPPGAHNVPGVVTDQLKNYPGLIIQSQDTNLPANPLPNNGYNTIYVDSDHTHRKPYDLNGDLHLPDSIIGKLKSDHTHNSPELTLEILLSLLGRPDGGKTLIGVNPQPESRLLQYLQPNNAYLGNQLIELPSPHNSNDIQNYVAYGPDGLPVQQSLLDILNNPQNSHTGTFSGNLKPDNAALLKKLQEWLAVSNSNKLPETQNNANVIELTYLLKRPKPLIYRPIYYVKYRLPYKSFIQNFKNLIVKRPGLRSEPENLYQELLNVSNISDVSPSLRIFPKEEILKLVFGNGTLVDARVVEVPDSALKEQLDTTRNVNADVDPEVIEKLSGNLVLNKSESYSNIHDRVDWLRIASQRTSKRDEYLTTDRIPTPKLARLDEPKSSNSVNESLTVFPVSSTEPSQPKDRVSPIVAKQD